MATMSAKTRSLETLANPYYRYFVYDESLNMIISGWEHSSDAFEAAIEWGKPARSYSRVDLVRHLESK